MEVHAKAHTAAWGLEFDLSSCHWPSQLGSPAISPSSYPPAHPRPSPHHWPPLPCAHPGETVQPQEECTPITRIPTATCGPRSSSVSCHWPTSLGSPAACPSSCEPTCPWPTSQHWAPRLCLWQEPVATALHNDRQDPITASVQSWLQPLLFALAPPPRVCLQLVPATTSGAGPAAKTVDTNTSSQQCCLPWSLPAGLGGTTEDPNSHCHLCTHTPQCFIKNHTAVDSVDARSLSLSQRIRHSRTLSH